MRMMHGMRGNGRSGRPRLGDFLWQTLGREPNTLRKSGGGPNTNSSAIIGQPPSNWIHPRTVFLQRPKEEKPGPADQLATTWTYPLSQARLGGRGNLAYGSFGKLVIWSFVLQAARRCRCRSQVEVNWNCVLLGAESSNTTLVRFWDIPAGLKMSA
jgi:hypothetical protein